MLKIMPRLPVGTIVINGATGEERRVKYQTRDHVQFEGGSSCSPRNFKMFYSEWDIVRPGEVKPWISGDERTKIVDNR
jgi:hypothetical protein